ncbi:uncharacterized protein [Primulina huaijiensis]|uniref:uncharacterized protein n=1 Tax=Primulina huaijiensis TaxID=1492673 RepID=UPI003CC7757F
MEEPESTLQILTPYCGGGRQCSNPNSPEFEFRMIRNPSFPQPNLLSADELFYDGFLLPLHKINLSNVPRPPPPRKDIIEASGPGEEPSNVESAELSASPRLTSSKRWMDIFKKSSRSSTTASADGNGKRKGIDDYSKEKRREKNNAVSASNGFSASELNINLWPFPRSRSAGNEGTRPRPASAARKVSSAPCSRSNSAGESKSRKWPSSPSRAAGVHLGRSSPVWQVRRGGSGGGVAVSARSSHAFLKSAQKGIRKDGNDIRRKTQAAGSVSGGPVYIDYRHHLSCRSDDNSAHGGGGGGGISGEGVRGNNLFNIRSLFTKKSNSVSI